MKTTLTYENLPLAAILAGEQSRTGVIASGQLLHTMYTAASDAANDTRSSGHPYHEALLCAGEEGRRSRQRVPTRAKKILDTLCRILLHQPTLLDAVLTGRSPLPAGPELQACSLAVTQHISSYATSPDEAVSDHVARVLLNGIAAALPAACVSRPDVAAKAA
jgi:hypothetical protein